MQLPGRRTAVLAALTSAVLFAAPAVATAETTPASAPTSSIEVSSTTLHRGDSLTVTQAIHNPEDFTVTGAKAALYTKSTPIVDLVDLVGCSEPTSTCYAYLSSYRGVVADLGTTDLGPGATRTVTFMFKVKDNAALGEFVLQNQFAGDNYAFDVLDAQSIKIVQDVAESADIKVALTATPRLSLFARVDYVITVSNTGTSQATGIRVTAAPGANRTIVSTTGCTRSASTLNCAIDSLAPGASTTAKFTTQGGLLAWGPFTATAERAASTPADTNLANDNAAKKCTAYTGLFVQC